MSIAHIARPAIRALRAYAAAEQLHDTIRLNANEAPWTSHRDTFRRPLNRYPEIRPAALRSALARHYNVRTEQLIVTRGTSEAIDLLIRIFCQDGRDNIVTTTPSFSMYPHYAQIQGAAVHAVRTDPDADFAVSADAVIKACDANSRLVFLCSPNNPTGTMISQDTLRTILDARRTTSAVVLDEAYIEFSAAESAVALLDDYPNLVVLRTLSKALACAGARCGVALASHEVIGMLDAVQAPYAISTLVAEWIETTLAADGLREAAERSSEIVAERERLAAEIARFGNVRRVWPSDANFLLVQFADARKVLAQARADGILLRHPGAGLDDCLRITIGSASDNDRLLQSLLGAAG